MSVATTASDLLQLGLAVKFRQSMYNRHIHGGGKWYQILSNICHTEDVDYTGTDEVAARMQKNNQIRNRNPGLAGQGLYDPQVQALLETLATSEEVRRNNPTLARHMQEALREVDDLRIKAILAPYTGEMIANANAKGERPKAPPLPPTMNLDLAADKRGDPMVLGAARMAIFDDNDDGGPAARGPPGRRGASLPSTRGGGSAAGGRNGWRLIGGLAGGAHLGRLGGGAAAAPAVPVKYGTGLRMGEFPPPPKEAPFNPDISGADGGGGFSADAPDFVPSGSDLPSFHPPPPPIHQQMDWHTHPWTLPPAHAIHGPPPAPFGLPYGPTPFPWLPHQNRFAPSYPTGAMTHNPLIYPPAAGGLMPRAASSEYSVPPLRDIYGNVISTGMPPRDTDTYTPENDALQEEADQRHVSYSQQPGETRRSLGARGASARSTHHEDGNEPPP